MISKHYKINDKQCKLTKISRWKRCRSQTNHNNEKIVFEVVIFHLSRNQLRFEMVRNCENCEIGNWATQRCSTLTKSLNLFFVVFGSRGLSRNTHTHTICADNGLRTIFLSWILSDVAQQPRRPRAENIFSQNDQRIHAHWAVSIGSQNMDGRRQRQIVCSTKNQ